MKSDVYDVIVVGSGAAGLAAACTAAAHGKRVLVLEAADRIGGTTAISGGMVWIPANHKMNAAGIEDSLDAARNYLNHTVPGSVEDPRMQAFLTRGDEAIRFLEAHTSLQLQAVRRYPDYYPDTPGATAGGRVLEPVPFDATALGPAFAQLRDPLPEFMLFGGMMVSREDLPILRRVGHSLGAVWHATKLVARYAMQRIRAHRGTTLVLGNALAARLFKSARDLDVEIAIEAAVVGMIMEGDRVAGVRVKREGQLRQLRANDAVILATGGISHHPDLRRDYIPAAAGEVSATAKSGAGRGGAHLAGSLGAKLSPSAATVDDALAFWVPVSKFRRADGSQAVFPHTVTDRAKPGLIAVNKDGRRFVNEAVSYHEFVRAQLRDSTDNIPAWLVCDKDFLWKYGLGRVRPFALSIKRDLETGYLKRGKTMEELAEVLGLPVRNFVDTVHRFNLAAVRGLDSEFGRGSNIYQRHLGDVDQRPNPCVAPIRNGPFYAVAVYPADLGMAAGIVTDEHARVLRKDGQPIAGLYACGNDMHSVMNGAYPGPGITLGPALVFGYIAGSHASGKGALAGWAGEMGASSQQTARRAAA
ncbi:FAD-dependent oxidoreductase [Ramlibacter sp. 2FC]|uniref:FAD-dependent oxidoreductase n=1 Tax=Ramlibacter sp. 2FC TaxID=2502188 RepID=UPI0010F9B7F9|nr:FAD-dependent oxidoreductase [Ramlibacter sp. 2FC]